MSRYDRQKVTRNLQKASIQIFAQFILFASRNNIRYCSLAGTALGAVRHKGFIPWDDDIDVGVPRDDYNALIKLAPAFPAPYKIECMEISDDYRFPFMKIYDTRTTIVENLEMPFKRGAWIDVFPLDGTFNNPIARKLHLEATRYFVRKLYVNKKARVKRSELKGTATRLSEAFWRAMPKFLIPTALTCLCNLRGPSESNKVLNLVGPHGETESISLSDLNHPRKERFCGLQVNVPFDAHSYLASLYGDYASPPPLEERTSHHEFLHVDLSKSYLEI